MKLTSISYHPKKAFIYYLVQWLIITLLLLLGFHLYDKTAIKLWDVKFLLIFSSAISVLFVIIPYLGPFRKISILYKDIENNLYVDKILVDKNLILSIELETVFYFRKSQEFYIMTFTNLADEIKEKNFNKNVIVFSDAKVLSKWPNFNPVSERYLNDIGIRKEIKHTISREKL